MPALHVVEGPIGAGKTTYAMQLRRRLATPPLVHDMWMATLFQPDRPETAVWGWYGERRARCMRQIMDLPRATLDCDRDAIIEIGLIRREQRLKVYAKLEAEAATTLCICSTRRARIVTRNAATPSRCT